MTHIDSKSIYTGKTADSVFLFLSDLNNHRLIMPSQVSGWSSDADTCHYTIAGTGTVHLKVEERVPASLVRLVPNGKIPFPFGLSWHIVQEGNLVKISASLDAELNPVLRMMATAPLTNFINMQVQKLGQVLDAE
jgi:hypothetical protein